MTTPAITDASRYDRQIRVWGAEAQKRIQSSKVLIVHLTNMNIEVVKNIVLAGVNISILDPRTVTAHDISNNFFLTMEDFGKQILDVALPRIRELNNFVNVQRVDGSVTDQSPSFYLEYQVICFSGGQEADVVSINNLVRKQGTICFWSDGSGDQSLFLADFGDSFQYVPDTAPGSNNGSADSFSSSSTASAATAAPKKEIKTMSFPSFESVCSVPWHTIPITRFQVFSKIWITIRTLHEYRKISHGRSSPSREDVEKMLTIFTGLMQQQQMDPTKIIDDTTTATKTNGSINWQQEMTNLCMHQSPVSILQCSILGSELSQEIIKAISQTGQPGANIWVHSGNNLAVRNFPIGMTSSSV